MKLNKFSGDKVLDSVSATGGVMAGGLLSNGISEVIPLENKKVAKALVMGFGLIAASMIGGNDTLATLSRNAALGMAGMQAGELLKEVTAPMLPAKDETSMVSKFIHASLSSNSAPVAIDASLARALGNPFETPEFLGTTQISESQEFAA